MYINKLSNRYNWKSKFNVTGENNKTITKISDVGYYSGIICQNE